MTKCDVAETVVLVIHTSVKKVWRCRDNRTAKSMKTSRDDGIKQFSIQHHLTYLPHNTCIMRKVCRVLYAELFYAIIPACFHTFCCSVIPTSPYIFNVFYTCLPHFYSSILDNIHSAHSTQF